MTSSRRRRAARRRKNIIIASLVAVLLIIIAVIIIAVNAGKSGPEDTAIVATPEPTEEIIVEETIEPTPEPAEMPVTAQLPTSTGSMLPILSKVKTTENKIAITIDDCFQTENLATIIDLTENYGGKLTLFPIGHVVYSKSNLRDQLVRAHEKGFEIENHTYDHLKIYEMTDEEMAATICKQNMVINKTLGVDYTMHFLRMMGGNGEDDPRSHQYLLQLGSYKAVAHWSYSGSDASLANIEKKLAPGMIFLFHTTDSDTAKLKEFIPYAASMGYELVTLNELCGLPENETSPLEGDPLSYDNIITPDPYEYTDYVSMSPGKTKMYCVQLVQNRLKELGYLKSSYVADGDYGKGTAEAIKKFQKKAGLEVDGYAGAATQTALFADNAPRNQ